MTLWARSFYKYWYHGLSRMSNLSLVIIMVDLHKRSVCIIISKESYIYLHSYRMPLLLGPPKWLECYIGVMTLVIPYEVITTITIRVLYMRSVCIIISEESFIYLHSYRLPLLLWPPWLDCSVRVRTLVFHMRLSFPLILSNLYMRSSFYNNK